MLLILYRTSHIIPQKEKFVKQESKSREISLKLAHGQVAVGFAYPPHALFVRQRLRMLICEARRTGRKRIKWHRFILPKIS